MDKTSNITIIYIYIIFLLKLHGHNKTSNCVSFDFRILTKLKTSL